MPISKKNIATTLDDIGTIHSNGSSLNHYENKSNETRNKEKTREAIEEILQPFDQESRRLIFHCLHHKYGLDPELIVEYKDEFRNYLCEVLGNEIVDAIHSQINNRLIIITAKNEKEVQQRREEEKDHFFEHSSPASYFSSTTSSVATSKDQKRKRTRISDEIHFLICDTCFWCASFLRSPVDLKCLSCGNEIKSAMPIAINEKFSFEVNERRGLSVFFSV